MLYINYKENGVVETVDEFKTMREAREMCKEYNMACSYYNHYVSSRCTKEWRTK